MKITVWLSIFVMLFSAMPIGSGNTPSSGKDKGKKESSAVAPGPDVDPDDDVVALLPGTTFDAVAGIVAQPVKLSAKQDSAPRPAARVSAVGDFHALGLSLGTVVRPLGVFPTMAESMSTGLRRTKKVQDKLARRLSDVSRISDGSDGSGGSAQWSVGEVQPQTARVDDSGEALTFEDFYATWVGLRLRVVALNKQLSYARALYSACLRDRRKSAVLLDKCNALLEQELERLGSSSVAAFESFSDLAKQQVKAVEIYERALSVASTLRMGAVQSPMRIMYVMHEKDLLGLSSDSATDSKMFSELLEPACFDCPVNHGRKLPDAVFDVETGSLYYCAWCGECFLKRFFDQSPKSVLRDCLGELIESTEEAEAYLRTITPGFIE